MRRSLALAFMLAACSGQGKSAEDRYDIVMRAPHTKAEECAAARDVEQGYLKDGREKEYREWKLRADTVCLLVQLTG